MQELRMKALLVALLSITVALPAALAADAPSSHEAAAREVVRLVGGSDIAESSAEAILGPVLQDPQLAPYADVFRDWIKKVLSTGDFEGEVAAIYVKHFTEQELRDLAAFYKTPLGQKAISTLPEVMKEGAEVGMARAKAHQGELIEALQKAKEAREAKQKSGGQ